MTYVIGGGYAMWVVLLCGMLVLATSARAVLKQPHEGAADTVMFWGGAALAIGFIGTLIGVSNAATAMAAAGAGAGSSLAWEGIRIALSTTIAGAAVFLLALACHWFLPRRQTP